MGDFGVLDGLENRVRVKAQKRCKTEKNTAKCKKLKEKYQELVKRRNELQEKLQNDLPVSSGEEIVETLSKIWKSRLERLLLCYQLTGVSVMKNDEGCALVRFDTSFQGQFMEAYFLELVNKKGPGIGKHSLPAFIPLEEFVKDMLAEDPEEFFSVIIDHLQAYVQRREHCKMAEPVSSGEEIVETLSKIWKSRLERLLLCYQLTGVSVMKNDEGCALVRFDTSFQGQFMEAYFLELVNKKGPGIGKHSLPAFIPLEEFVKDMLAEDPEEFFSVIIDHLQAYVQRREHCKMAETILKDRGYIKGEITSSFAVDIIQINIERNTLMFSPVKIVLRFGSLLHIEPDSAQISVLKYIL